MMRRTLTMRETRELEALQSLKSRSQDAREWYRVENTAAASSSSAPAMVSIYDEIGYGGATAADFIKDLGGIKGPLDLHINSPGGDVFDGIAIYNAIRQRGNVTAIIDSLCASIATVVAMGADRVKIATHGQMMIHEASGIAIGNASDARQLADLLDKQSDNIAAIYAGRTGKPAATWRDAMRSETWYIDQEAVDAGLADEVLMQASNSLRNASADESAWDAGKAWAAGAASKDPAAFYNAICAGKKAGDPSTQGAHALPHHYHPGDAPNRHGVSAALGRIGQTDGLTNEAEARRHLEAHQSAMGSGSGSSGNSLDEDLTFDASQFLELLKGA